VNVTKPHILYSAAMHVCDKKERKGLIIVNAIISRSCTTSKARRLHE